MEVNDKCQGEEKESSDEEEVKQVLSLSDRLTGETAVRVTVGYSDTFTDPRACHCNRRSL